MSKKVSHGPNCSCCSPADAPKKTWEVVRDRILDKRKRLRGKAKDQTRFFANDNISQFVDSVELSRIRTELEEKMGEVLDILLIDWRNDHNSKGTPQRLAKMMLYETMVGRYTPMPDVTDFPNASNLDQLYTVGPIAVKSKCSHHHAPIIGEAYVGVFPGDRVIGLSKFHRLLNWIMRRPQIQEESTVQYADLLENLMTPKGVAVVVKCRHFCACWRGVNDDRTWMTTSVMRGVFREDSIKTEFLRFVDLNSKD